MKQFSTPAEAAKILQEHNTAFKAAVEQKIRESVDRCGGEVRIRPNERLQFPSIYAESGCATILGLKAVKAVDGRVVFVSDSILRIRKPHCDNITISELLQAWEIVEANVRS